MAGGMGGFFRRLFGGKAEPAAPEPAASVEYNGYTIRPEPTRQGAGWLTVGTIVKQFPDGPKEHRFIRADTYPDRDSAVAFCTSKAKQIIDEQGDRIFAERPKPAA